MSVGRIAGIGLAMWLLWSPAYAAQLKVYPIRIALTTEEPVATMTVANDGQEPTLIQLNVSAWRQEGGEDVFEPTREVLANPAIFELKPAGQQIVRFGLRSREAVAEGSYRVFIQEVPRQHPGKPGEVITLLRISVPVFAPVERAVRQTDWRVWPEGEGKTVVEIRNRGNTHVQLTSLKLTGPDHRVRGTLSVSAYVLPGASRRISVPATIPLGGSTQLLIEATTDQGNVSAMVVTDAGPDSNGSR